MTRRGVLALALILAAPASGAVSLGQIEVRSYLGDKLDARIAVAPGAGESIRGACFSLSPEATPGVPRLSVGELVLQRSASGTYLRIRSAVPVDDPALALGIVIACPGQVPQGTKEFSVLVDPRTRATAPTVEAGRPAPAASTRLGAREGDTLASLANAIFPRDPAARTAYLAAMREANPGLAARGDREPIASNEAVALPDLRTFMQGRRTQAAPAVAAAGMLPSAASELAAAPPAREAPARASSARRAAPAQPPTDLSGAEQASAPRDVARAKPPAAASPAAAPPRPRTVSSGFQLKLSASEVDLTRSNTIDDRSRAQLRERLLMLDADDQVAAMLSMRNSLRQLEARVAELQLKLAGMPPSLAGKGEGGGTAKATPKSGPPSPVVAPKAEPAAPVIAAAPKAEPPPPVIAATPKPETRAAPPAAAPKIETTPAPPVVEPAKPPPQPAADGTPTPATAKAPPTEARPARAVPKPAPAKASALPNWLWAVVALLVVLVLLVAWYMLRRRRAREPEFYEEDYEAPAQEPVDEIAPEATPIHAEEPEVSFEPAHQGRGVMDSDADLATRLPEENADELRRRYIEERFPEIVSRMIVPDDADSVVKGARLFYEDRALPRAVELLQFAVETHPEEVKTWLALFEIFRLERLTGEFATLATRFKQHHGQSEHWRKVQYFGREIDPGNALYREEPVNTLETIGPREARRLAAAASFDPIAENWLNAPMDFENEVLANELRRVLMQHAGLTEHDLAPDPMTALRNVEMFTVA